MRIASILLLCAACQQPSPYDEVEAALKKCPGATTLKGIDVSIYQGTIDWPKVKAAGMSFAIARVGDGLGFDSKFDANWAGIKKVGLVRGVYQFFRPGDDPIQQADLLLSHMGTLGDGDLPPVMDLEVTDGKSNAVIIANMKKWLEHVATKSGRVPMIYTSPGFYSSLGNPHFSQYHLWVAHWQTMCPSLPPGWSSFAVWQNADNGTVNGISGAVDTDLFDGDLDQLHALASNPEPPPSPPKPSPTPTPSPSVEPSPTPEPDNESARLQPVGKFLAPELGQASDGGCSMGGSGGTPLLAILLLLGLMGAARRRRDIMLPWLRTLASGIDSPPRCASSSSTPTSRRSSRNMR